MRQEPFVMRDPTAETSEQMRDRIKPPPSLDGRTVALFSISKERSAEFLDTLEACFGERGVNVLRVEKPTHTKPAPTELIQDVVEHADVVVEGLAD